MAIQYNELQKMLKTTTDELFVLISIYIIQKMVVLTATKSLQDWYSFNDQGINY